MRSKFKSSVCGFILKDNYPASEGSGLFHRELSWFAQTREDAHSFANGRWIYEQVVLVNKPCLNERRNKTRAAVHDNVGPIFLVFQLIDLSREISFRKHGVLPGGFLQRSCEHDLRGFHHFLGQRELRIVGSCHHALPIGYEAIGHFPSQENSPNRV